MLKKLELTVLMGMTGPASWVAIFSSSSWKDYNQLIYQGNKTHITDWLITSVILNLNESWTNYGVYRDVILSVHWQVRPSEQCLAVSLHCCSDCTADCASFCNITGPQWCLISWIISKSRNLIYKWVDNFSNCIELANFTSMSQVSSVNLKPHAV